MNIEWLTEFFMWCTILNLGVLIVWSLVFIVLPDFVYKVQTRFIPLPRDSFNKIIYSLLGAYKLFFIVFCLAPYVALLIIEK